MRAKGQWVRLGSISLRRTMSPGYRLGCSACHLSRYWRACKIPTSALSHLVRSQHWRLVSLEVVSTLEDSERNGWPMRKWLGVRGDMPSGEVESRGRIGRLFSVASAAVNTVHSCSKVRWWGHAIFLDIHILDASLPELTLYPLYTQFTSILVRWAT